MRSPRPTMLRAVSTCCLRCAFESLVSSSGSSTFWNAVSTGMRLYIWKMKPTCRARHSVSLPADKCVISSPATLMVPRVGTSSPPSRFSSVVLPEPLGPMKATNSPFSTSRLSPCRTSISSLPRRYFLSSPRTWMRLLPSPRPSTRTMPSPLSLHLHGRAIAQSFESPYHDLLAAGEAREDLLVVAPRAAHSDRTSFDMPVLIQVNDLAATFVTHRGLRNERLHLAGVRALGLYAQERDLHAHVGQNARVELVEGDPHFHRGLLPVRGRNHGADLGRNLPIWIRIEDRGYRHSRFYARDVGLVHVYLDLQRLHVHHGRDASAGETAAGRDRRHHLSHLRILRHGNAVERRAHDAVRQVLLRDADACLRGLDLLPGQRNLRFQAVGRRPRQVKRLLAG